MPDNFDVAIVGAGPSGCAAAIVLAEAGIRTALIEKARFPRHKVCGEFLSGRCRGALERLGVLAEVLSHGPPDIHQAILASRTRRLCVPFSDTDHGLPFGLSRHALDDILLRRAAAVGVMVFSPALARRFDEAAGRVQMAIRTQEGERTLTAGKLLVADGQVRGLASADGHKPPPVDQVGIKAHFAGLQFEVASAELYRVPGGYVGLGPIEQDQTNLCAAIELSEFRRHRNDPVRWFNAASSYNPLFAARMAEATQVNGWLTSPLPRFGYRRPRHANVLAVGTAAAAFDPIVGEGIWMALFSGIRAAELLLNQPTKSAALSEKSYLSQFRPRRAIARLMFSLCRSETVTNVSLGLLNCSPGLLRMLVRTAGK